MKLPDITHLQYVVLATLSHQSRTGRELREALRKASLKKSGPIFYQMMARLEEARFVEGWYTQTIIDSQIIKERNYKLTPKGRKSLNDCRAFYDESQSFGLKDGLAYAT